MEKTTKRLAPTSETIKKLLLRSGNECAFPNCNEVLFNDKDILIGECCHIEGALPGGERYNPNQSDEERRSYGNLLFLCHKHHVESDDELKYTVDTLKEIKLNHENRFREKPIAIKDDYIKQVFSYFDEILSITKETSNAVKRIEEKQDDILEFLKSSEPIKDRIYFEEYFGAPPTILFEGRIKEIKELSSIFNKYNTFIVGGISGIGKTSLLAYFLNKITSHKILWIDCEVIKTNEIFFDYLSRFLKQEFNDESIKHALSTSDNDIINKSILHALQKNKCCIVFDALNSDTHDLITTIKTLNEYLRYSKVFISTNYNLNTLPWRNVVYKIDLSGVEKNDFLKIIETYNLADISLEHSDRLFKILSGHPYLLKLSISLLQYQPANYLIESLEGKRYNEIKEYIKKKVLEILSQEDRNLLVELSDFIFPFRYSIGNFLNLKNFSQHFKVLKDSFLIEKINNDFFIIPEFIRTSLSEYKKSTIKIELHNNYTNYLLSLTKNIVIFEKDALIYHALEANLIEIAKREAKNFLSSLMANGYFNLAFKIASELEQNPKMTNFSFIYYIQGRILRFQESYQEALEKYNIGLKYNDDSIETNGLIFEKASMLTYLAEKLDDKKLLKDALEIYKDLSKNEDATLAAQSRLSTIIILKKSKKGDEIQKQLEKLKNSIDENKVEINVQASIWQLLGKIYSENKQHKNAFLAFEKSISFYKYAISRFGMNIIDGLYHAYESYGWACVEIEDYFNAVEKFKVCVDLCESFDLGLKKESALFDYGYHLIVTQQFKKASDILSEYYSFILENGQIEDNDLPLIFGTLAFAYWYSNSFLEAIESLGVYLIYCSKESIRPIISVMQSDDMSQEIDFIHFFQKRVYILILPTGMTFNDLKNWITIVTNKRPELLEPLTEFYFFRKEE